MELLSVTDDPARVEYILYLALHVSGLVSGFENA